VATLDQEQRQFKDSGLVPFERKFLSALRHLADGIQLLLVIGVFGGTPLNDNPGSTTRACHASTECDRPHENYRGGRVELVVQSVRRAISLERSTQFARTTGTKFRSRRVFFRSDSQPTSMLKRFEEVQTPTFSARNSSWWRNPAPRTPLSVKMSDIRIIALRSSADREPPLSVIRRRSNSTVSSPFVFQKA